jgi:hypothetical protein
VVGINTAEVHGQEQCAGEAASRAAKRWSLRSDRDAAFPSLGTGPRSLRPAAALRRAVAIDGIERDACARVAELEQQIAEQQKKLKRWCRALDRTEGRGPEPAQRRRGTAALEVDDERLVGALRDAGEPLSAGELRKA